MVFERKLKESWRVDRPSSAERKRREDERRRRKRRLRTVEEDGHERERSREENHVDGDLEPIRHLLVLAPTPSRWVLLVLLVDLRKDKDLVVVVPPCASEAKEERRDRLAKWKRWRWSVSLEGLAST